MPTNDIEKDKAQAAVQTIRQAADKGLEKVEEGVDKAANIAHDVTDKALDGAEHALRQTRRAVNAGVDQAQEGLQRLGEYADPRIDALACKALDIATHSIHLMADTTERASLRAQRCSDAAQRYVQQQPGKALLMAAAAGAILTALLTRRR
ncbi:hypothetical protein EBQ25_06670 [Allofranklinella schreckenbergeri]|uniref:DUF883 domain-containing protein n=1 Tax=Allofranklinella schreckenbergeri TaxID=1076744 RepID=A0A3M6Q990_9BURK|nr:hypothetical protein [Allofranklinella schreckenbergeri]RMW99743.1 hypothetical protein EBQ25_06670 [Allofranklinella schreckenbergeri]